MSDRVNKAGHAVWFVRGEEGTVRPVTAEGRRAMVLAFALVLMSGVGLMALLLWTQDPRWIAAAFIIDAIGLGAFAATAMRHLE